MKGKKIIAGIACAALALGAGIGMAACSDNKTYVADGAELVSAIKEAEAGSVIALSENIDLDEVIIVDKEIVLDLNGKTLSAGDEINDITMFRVVTGGDLTIDGNGKIDAATQANDYSMAIWARDGGKVVINSGTFTNLNGKAFEDDGDPNNNELIYASHTGEIIINGGTFIGNYENETWGTRYTLNMLDEKANTETIEKGTITVKGGKFYEYNPKESLSENPQANFVADGYDVTLVEGYYIVSAK